MSQTAYAWAGMSKEIKIKYNHRFFFSSYCHNSHFQPIFLRPTMSNTENMTKPLL